MNREDGLCAFDIIAQQDGEINKDLRDIDKYRNLLYSLPSHVHIANMSEEMCNGSYDIRHAQTIDKSKINQSFFVDGERSAIDLNIDGNSDDGKLNEVMKSIKHDNLNNDYYTAFYGRHKGYLSDAWAEEACNTTAEDLGNAEQSNNSRDIDSSIDSSQHNQNSIYNLSGVQQKNNFITSYYGNSESILCSEFYDQNSQFCHDSDYRDDGQPKLDEMTLDHNLLL